MTEQTYDFTLEGINRLKEELEKRKTEDRSEIAERIKVALSFGDLSENSEYDEAKMAQAMNEGRIAELENLLKNARLIEEDDISKTKVALGGKVTLQDVETKEETEYTLVSSKEEDIFERKISTESPVGAAIVGKKKGQSVSVATPRGILRYKIVKIG
ncbi:MAG: transcription elongation factor GreA [Clostridia bacterium]|nr:transcription elongation factor GreA [Clostridia bacterium]NLF21205.1 transcription elongation factor GreA [Clostridiaceae bacterium]